jgi:hypothetical protein
MDHENSPVGQLEGPVLAVVLETVLGLVRPLRKVEQITRVIAVNEVDWQAQTDDCMQGGRGHQIAAVQHGLSAQRFRFRNGRGERLAMVVTVGDDADFQAAPPRAL